MIGPQDDFDDIAEGKPSGEGAPPAGTRNVGGPDLRGNPAAFRFEEVGRYRGMIAAAMERAGWAMELAKTGSSAILSRFFNMVGGVASDDGLEPNSNFSPLGTGQRLLVTPSGAVWVQLVPSPDVINWVAERNAIVGEDSRGVPLQGLRTSKEVSAGVTMAAELTGSVLATAWASLAASQVIHIDRAKHQTVRVAYTPGVTGERCILYPQITQGEVPEVWSFLPTFQDAVSQFTGPTDPPAMVQPNLGHFGFDPFAAYGELVAATEYVATFVLGDAYPHRWPACKAVRFVVQDTSTETAGVVTIWATQE